MTQFKRNKESIKQSSNFTRLTKTGAYTGHFKNAYERESSSSASLAIHFDFVADSGETCAFDLWHTGRNGDNLDKNGNELSGYVSVMELMTVFDQDNLATKKQTIEVYDFSVGQNVAKQVKFYNNLIDKQIGVVFQAIKKEKQVEGHDGKWINVYPLQFKDGIEFVKFFNAETNQTAFEVENDQTGKELDRILANIPEIKWPKGVDSDAKNDKSEDKAIIKKPENLISTDANFDDDFPF